MLLVFIVAGVGCFNVEKEPTIELTQREFMIIYKNGYVSGRLNQARYVDSLSSENVWKIDSVEISDRFFLFLNRKK